MVDKRRRGGGSRGSRERSGIVGCNQEDIIIGYPLYNLSVNLNDGMEEGRKERGRRDGGGQGRRSG